MEPSLGARYCCIKDYEITARSVLSKNALGYYTSGACAEYSLKENKEAFKKYCQYRIKSFNIVSLYMLCLVQF
jgi:hypothetical protein